MSEIALPQYQIGEKVLFHIQPLEDWCPLCHYQFGTKPYPGLESPDSKVIVTIIGPADKRFYCPHCRGIFSSSSEGWWLIKENKIGELAAPYTLLERLNEE